MEVLLARSELKLGAVNNPESARPPALRQIVRQGARGRRKKGNGASDRERARIKKPADSKGTRRRRAEGTEEVKAGAETPASRP
jgi:hypothetical protein